MRDLIISIICMFCLIIPWGIYDQYSMKTINNYRQHIDNEILPAIASDDWQKAENDMTYIAKDWDKYKAISAYFVDTTSVNEVDSTVSKALYYIKYKDPSNSTGEAAYLKYRFNFLHENQSPSFANIF